MNLKGKKLLVFGSNYSTVNLVKLAHKHGVHVTVTSDTGTGQAADIADNSIAISSNEYQHIIDYIKSNGINGVMTGASEFHILNMIRVCGKMGLPVYASEKQWNICQDKRNFKDLCKQYNVPGVPEYGVDDILEPTDFPVIVKPIDGCSSRGISVCYNTEELAKAKRLALDSSPSKSILIERYINNGGITNMVKYLAIDGKYHIEAMGDRYVLNNGLITANTFYPSKYLDNWIKNVDPKVKDMLRGLGMKNGLIAFQTIPDGDNIYIYECCLRLTGGMTYKMTDAVGGNNSMEMLLNYALTGKMCDENDLDKIDPRFHGRYGSSFAIPVKTGTISSIEGFEDITKIDNVVDFTHYYVAGDTIVPKNLNTLDQLYARIMVVADSENEIFESLQKIRNTLKIKDENGENMIIWDTYDNIYRNR